MSDDVSEGNGDQHREEDIVYLRGLRAGAVEKDGNEPDGDMKNLAGYLVPVDL